MPRYDRTGPVGTGPRTGRGLGDCGRPADRTTEVEDPYQDNRIGGFGRRWGGGRGRGFGSGGAGRRRRFRMGRRTSDDPAGDDVTPRRRQAFLRRRIEELTAQLDRVNRMFSGGSRDGTQDQD